ncbi:acyl-CoA thioester hydrolase/BAAT C-terminal domain-containing protein [Halomicroarcula sp. GCM10025709]
MATWLQSREAVTDRIGVLGHSKGAEFALMAASRYDVFDGVVAIAPNAFAFMAPGMVSAGPSWAVDGEPVPTLSRSGNSEIRRKEGRLVIADQIRADLSAADQAQLDRAAIPVEQITGDVLLVGGLDDTIWPMEEMIPRLTARLDTESFQHRVASLVYDEAGHVITVPHKPTTYHHLGGQLYLGGQPEPAAAAEADAWPRIVRWFRDALSGSAQ